MVKTYVVCPGLGHINRGFETFTRELFDELESSPDLDLRLFKGAGPHDGFKERAIPTIRRTTRQAALVGALLRKGDYGAEAISFGTSLLPYLLKDRPDVVFFSDWFVGKLLRIWRRSFRLNFKLLFSNSGPFEPERFCWNHIQQVSPQYLQDAVTVGIRPEMQTLLPLGHNISSTAQIASPSERAALRRRLLLPENGPVVLSVGAIRAGGHKRIEYLVSEIAQLPPPRPFLVVLGEKEEGADGIERLACEALGPDNFTMRSVPKTVVDEYYRAADIFTLTSLREGFGRVYVEALSHGLPCLTHDHLTARYVLDTFGSFGDLRVSGSLAALLQRSLTRSCGMEDKLARHAHVYERFSWDKLRQPYIDMIVRVAQGKSAPLT